MKYNIQKCQHRLQKLKATRQSAVNLRIFKQTLETFGPDDDSFVSRARRKVLPILGICNTVNSIPVTFKRLHQVADRRFVYVHPVTGGYD